MEDNTFKITLKIGEKEKTFTNEPTGRIVRIAADLSEKLQKEVLTTKTLDEMAEFAVKLFGNQFTVDDLYDGLSIGKLGTVCLGYVNEVISRFYFKGEKLPNVETREQV